MVNQKEPLCLQPMTHGDARYAEGRRAGLWEAAGHVEALRAEVHPKHASRGVVRDALVWASDSLRAKAGEP